MCGIAGVVELRSGEAASEEGLRRMAATMTHRGPDEEGVFLDGGVALAHRRLSIIDLVAGGQPMASAGGQVVLVFNGEIYNFLELREELERKGHTFRTRSDTEVLLELYRAEGLDAFARLSGMFALAIWDAPERRLVLARDRFGKKPLFYVHDDERFVFASELKAVLAYGRIERRINPRALDEYLSHMYITGEESILDGIRKLPPAHVLVLEDGRARSFPYWRLEFAPGSIEVGEEEALERLSDLLSSAVKRRMISDVPLGAFLSGGLDSSVVVALMCAHADRPVKTFSIGFHEEEYSELEDARIVARHLGTDHAEEIVNPSAWDILEDLVWHCDEPFGDSSAVPTYYVCRAARKHVTVALSGDGGDEVFAGYTRYLEIERHRRSGIVPRWIRRGLAGRLVSMLPFTAPGWNYLSAVARRRDDALPVDLGIFPYIKDRLYTASMRQAVRSFDPFAGTEAILGRVEDLDPVSRYQYLDTLQYLPGDILVKVDRMSMASSLEVRSPLLDHDLVEFAARLPVSWKLHDGVSKRILRRFAGTVLPQSVLEKRKQGFAVPKDVWFRGELRDRAGEILLDRRTVERGFFERRVIERMLAHHATGARDYSDWIWCLVVLEMWMRLYADRSWDRLAAATGRPAADAVRLSR